jgi:hypothetical protein
MAAVWEHLQDPGLFGTASPWFPGKIYGKRYDRGPILFRPGRDAFGGVHWVVRVSTGFLRMRQGHKQKWNGKKYKVQPKSSRCIFIRVKSKPTFKSSVDSDLVWKLQHTTWHTSSCSAFPRREAGPGGSWLVWSFAAHATGREVGWPRRPRWLSPGIAICWWWYIAGEENERVSSRFPTALQLRFSIEPYWAARFDCSTMPRGSKRATINVVRWSEFSFLEMFYVWKA